jgi:hypothetical protein
MILEYSILYNHMMKFFLFQPKDGQDTWGIKSASNQVSQHLNWKRSGGERDDNGGGKLDASIEPRTRPDAEGIGTEQEELQSDVKRYRGYD